MKIDKAASTTPISTDSGTVNERVSQITWSGGSIPPGQFLRLGLQSWPIGVQAIRLTGTFDWPSTPSGIKRLCALLVWDRLKPMESALRRASARASFGKGSA